MTVYFVKEYQQVFQLLFSKEKHDIYVYHSNNFVNSTEPLLLIDKVAI